MPTSSSRSISPAPTRTPSVGASHSDATVSVAALRGVARLVAAGSKSSESVRTGRVVRGRLRGTSGVERRTARGGRAAGGGISGASSNGNAASSTGPASRIAFDAARPRLGRLDMSRALHPAPVAFDGSGSGAPAASASRLTDRWRGRSASALAPDRRTSDRDRARWRSAVALARNRRQLEISRRFALVIGSVERQLRIGRKRRERKIVLTVPATVGGFEPEIAALRTLHSLGGDTGAALDDADDASAPATANSSR